MCGGCEWELGYSITLVPTYIALILPMPRVTIVAPLAQVTITADPREKIYHAEAVTPLS